MKTLECLYELLKDGGTVIFADKLYGETGSSTQFTDIRFHPTHISVSFGLDFFRSMFKTVFMNHFGVERGWTELYFVGTKRSVDDVLGYTKIWK